LTNEKYIGNNIYNKTSSKLKSRLVKTPNMNGLDVTRHINLLFQRKNIIKLKK
jgi:hypothetical protein